MLKEKKEIIMCWRCETKQPIFASEHLFSWHNWGVIQLGYIQMDFLSWNK